MSLLIYAYVGCIEVEHCLVTAVLVCADLQEVFAFKLIVLV